MKLNRRSFLASSAAGAASVQPLLATTAGAAEAHGASRPRVKLGISTYSYWHFKTEKVPIEKVIDKAADIGVQGVDILHRQMDLPEKDPLDAAGRAYLRKLKRHAFTNGIDLICVSTHQTFVSPKPDEVAKVWEGHKSLFTGVDLSGWKTEAGAWKVAGGHLVSAGKGELTTEKSFGPTELIFDWKVPAKAAKAEGVVSVGGTPITVTLPAGAKPGTWNRQTIKAGKVRASAPIVFKPAQGLEIMNVFARELTEK